MDATAKPGPGILLVFVAGLVLGIVAWRAKPRDYVPPSAAGTVPLRLEGEPPEGCEVRAFEVEGVCCSGCAAPLHEALSSIDGVRKLALDPATRRVEVLVRSEVDNERLTAALTFDEFVAHPRP
jgi:copper chaperone CopZ